LAFRIAHPIATPRTDNRSLIFTSTLNGDIGKGRL
jgi:hypothetical protein